MLRGGDQLARYPAGVRNQSEDAPPFIGSTWWLTASGGFLLGASRSCRPVEPCHWMSCAKIAAGVALPPSVSVRRQR